MFKSMLYTHAARQCVCVCVFFFYLSRVFAAHKFLTRSAHDATYARPSARGDDGNAEEEKKTIISTAIEVDGKSTA